MFASRDAEVLPDKTADIRADDGTGERLVDSHDVSFHGRARPVGGA